MKSRGDRPRPVGHRLQCLFEAPGPRLLALAALVLVLLIPLGMIESRVQERAARRDQAALDITRSWGGAQTVAGPMLRLPWRQTWKEKGVQRSQSGLLTVLPEVLDSKCRLAVEVRRRGIFEIPVFRAHLRFSGRFVLPAQTQLPAQVQGLEWSRAEIILPLSEPRALGAASRFLLKGEQLAIEPAGDLMGVAGVAIPLGPRATAASLAAGEDFVLDIQLTGTDRIALAPVGRSSQIEVQGDWPHPAFDGNWLPAARTVSDSRFTANWAVSHLGRGYPGLWVDQDVKLDRVLDSAVGVSLQVPVDPYRMAERMAKYALLLILMCFAAVWVMELVGAHRLHPVQYLLLGASLCLFDLLQLALAEHLGFLPAFLIAAAAVVGQAALYARNATGSTRHALVLAVLLGVWFAYLYVILLAEDLAFLLGAGALFLGLSAVMWATRRVEWSPRADWELATATLDTGS